MWGVRMCVFIHLYACYRWLSELVSGQAWETMIKDYVYTPLGMRSAGFALPHGCVVCLTPTGADQPAAIMYACVCASLCVRAFLCTCMRVKLAVTRFLRATPPLP
jgi:CubicO group peptidase (beta-lactamase class C family)